MMTDPPYNWRKLGEEQGIKEFYATCVDNNYYQSLLKLNGVYKIQFLHGFYTFVSVVGITTGVWAKRFVPWIPKQGEKYYRNGVLETAHITFLMYNSSIIPLCLCAATKPLVILSRTTEAPKIPVNSYYSLMGV
jgi:hypothetical protein